MAYSIVFSSGQETSRDNIFYALSEEIAKEGTFQIGLTSCYETKNRPAIRIKPVRLVKAKPYCGNHPGECVVNPIFGAQKKPNAKFLEWDDWIKFHGLVNGVLDRFHVEADVWSTPMDVSGKMLIRIGLKARRRYDWSEEHRYGRIVRVWNKGTPDQFV